MVQDVINTERGFGTDAFGESNIFLYSHIQIPIRQAAEGSITTAPFIKTQYQWTKGVVHRSWISEDAEACGAVVDGRRRVLDRLHTIRVGVEVIAIGGAKILPAAVTIAGGTSICVAE